MIFCGVSQRRSQSELFRKPPRHHVKACLSNRSTQSTWSMKKWKQDWCTVQYMNLCFPHVLCILNIFWRDMLDEHVTRKNASHVQHESQSQSMSLQLALQHVQLISTCSQLFAAKDSKSISHRATLPVKSLLTFFGEIWRFAWLGLDQVTSKAVTAMLQHVQLISTCSHLFAANNSKSIPQRSKIPVKSLPLWSKFL